MNRKALAAIGAAAALSLTLAACGSGSGNAPDDEVTESSGPVDLSVAVWSMEQTPEFQALFDAFQRRLPGHHHQARRHPPAEYNTLVTPTWPGAHHRLLTMKTLTDYSRFAGRGQLQDVTDLVELPDGISGAASTGRRRGSSAVPYRHDSWVLYYNKALFDAAGLDYPDHVTWDDYNDAADRAELGSRRSRKRREGGRTSTAGSRRPGLRQCAVRHRRARGRLRVHGAVLRQRARPAERRRPDRLQHERGQPAHLPGRVRQAERGDAADGHVVRRDAHRPAGLGRRR